MTDGQADNGSHSSTGDIPQALHSEKFIVTGSVFRYNFDDQNLIWYGEVSPSFIMCSLAHCTITAGRGGRGEVR